MGDLDCTHEMMGFNDSSVQTSVHEDDPDPAVIKKERTYIEHE